MLQLDYKFRITLDDSGQNLQLEKYEDVTNKKTKEIRQEWKLIGYFGLSLRSALLTYVKMRMVDMVAGENVEASRLISDISKLENEISKISKEIVFEVKEKKKDGE